MDKSVYRRPHKPAFRPVKRRNTDEAPFGALPELSEPIIVHQSTECHVTPADVATRMVKYLDIEEGAPVLEPSAGTGNLIAALLDAGVAAADVVAIEQSYELCESIRARFTKLRQVEPLQRCFLTYANELQGRVQYSRILLNPPFRQVRRHMAAALSLLGNDGTLVGLVPITYHHEEAEQLEILPSDAFASCQVNTQLIRIQR